MPEKIHFLAFGDSLALALLPMVAHHPAPAWEDSNWKGPGHSFVVPIPNWRKLPEGLVPSTDPAVEGSDDDVPHADFGYVLRNPNLHIHPNIGSRALLSVSFEADIRGAMVTYEFCLRVVLSSVGRSFDRALLPKGSRCNAGL